MEFEIINTSRRKGEKIDYGSAIFKVKAANVIDFDHTEELGAALKTLIKGGLTKVIIDMQGLTFIDSLGIGMLINTAKLLRANNGDLTLINVPEIIDKIFKPINLPRFIKIFNVEEEAVRFLKVYV